MAGDDRPTLVWRMSSACIPSDCVEVASRGHEVLIRDSADCAGAMLRFSFDAWRGFISRIDAGSAIVAFTLSDIGSCS